jgi:hypothetical protein
MNIEFFTNNGEGSNLIAESIKHSVNCPRLFLLAFSSGDILPTRSLPPQTPQERRRTFRTRTQGGPQE